MPRPQHSVLSKKKKSGDGKPNARKKNVLVKRRRRGTDANASQLLIGDMSLRMTVAVAANVI
jgi:hypothetical protein